MGADQALARIGDRLGGWSSSSRLRDRRTIALVSDLGWRGVDFCLGVNTGAEFEDVTPNGHFFGIQLNHDAITTSIKTESGWTDVYNPPMGIWVHPQGETFSIRHQARSRWAAIVVPRTVFDSVCRRPMEIEPVRGVADDVSANIFCSLVHQLSSSDAAVANNAALSEQLIRTLILAVSRNARPGQAKGGLTAVQVTRLKEWLSANLNAKLSVDAMARKVDVSKAHFSREFKRTTGATPWEFVTELRVERAREMLSDGEVASSVAAACGFADQAHLCRVIKNRFGTSPSKLRHRLQ